MRDAQAPRFFDARIFGINTQKYTVKANIMQKKNIKSNFMIFISVTMQIAVIEAFRSEANKLKEEFDWLKEQR